MNRSIPHSLPTPYEDFHAMPKPTLKQRLFRQPTKSYVVEATVDGANPPYLTASHSSLSALPRNGRHVDYYSSFNEMAAAAALARAEEVHGTKYPPRTNTSSKPPPIPFPSVEKGIRTSNGGYSNPNQERKKGSSTQARDGVIRRVDTPILTTNKPPIHSNTPSNDIPQQQQDKSASISQVHNLDCGAPPPSPLLPAGQSSLRLGDHEAPGRLSHRFRQHDCSKRFAPFQHPQHPRPLPSPLGPDRLPTSHRRDLLLLHPAPHLKRKALQQTCSSTTPTKRDPPPDMMSSHR